MSDRENAGGNKKDIAERNKLCYSVIEQINIVLRGGAKFPTGGIVRDLRKQLIW